MSPPRSSHGLRHAASRSGTGTPHPSWSGTWATAGHWVSTSAAAGCGAGRDAALPAPTARSLDASRWGSRARRTDRPRPCSSSMMETRAPSSRPLSNTPPRSSAVGQPRGTPRSAGTHPPRTGSRRPRRARISVSGRGHQPHHDPPAWSPHPTGARPHSAPAMASASRPSTRCSRSQRPSTGHRPCGIDLALEPLHPFAAAAIATRERLNANAPDDALARLLPDPQSLTRMAGSLKMAGEAFELETSTRRPRSGSTVSSKLAESGLAPQGDSTRPTSRRNLQSPHLDPAASDAFVAAPRTTSRIGEAERRHSYATDPACSLQSVDGAPSAPNPCASSHRPTKGYGLAGLAHRLGIPETGFADMVPRPGFPTSCERPSATTPRAVVSMPVLNGHTPPNVDFGAWSLVPAHNDLRAMDPTDRVVNQSPQLCPAEYKRRITLTRHWTSRRTSKLSHPRCPWCAQACGRWQHAHRGRGRFDLERLEALKARQVHRVQDDAWPISSTAYRPTRGSPSRPTTASLFGEDGFLVMAPSSTRRSWKYLFVEGLVTQISHLDTPSLGWLTTAKVRSFSSQRSDAPVLDGRGGLSGVRVVVERPDAPCTSMGCVASNLARTLLFQGTPTHIDLCRSVLLLADAPQAACDAESVDGRLVVVSPG